MSDPMETIFDIGHLAARKALLSAFVTEPDAACDPKAIQAIVLGFMSSFLSVVHDNHGAEGLRKVCVDLAKMIEATSEDVIAMREREGATVQ